MAVNSVGAHATWWPTVLVSDNIPAVAKTHCPSGRTNSTHVSAFGSRSIGWGNILNANRDTVPFRYRKLRRNGKCCIRLDLSDGTTLRLGVQHDLIEVLVGIMRELIHRHHDGPSQAHHKCRHESPNSSIGRRPSRISGEVRPVTPTALACESLFTETDFLLRS